MRASWHAASGYDPASRTRPGPEVKRLLFLLMLMACSIPLQRAEAAPVRKEVLDLGRLATGRPGIVDLWFPQGDCAAPTRRYCLADTAATHKVVVFSPGAMGSAAEYAWIGERLAASGFVVVGINPYGESRIYGKPSQDPRSTTLIWQRPQDVSAVLDRLAKQPLFQRAVDWNKVVAVGHSAGGQTAAMLAGARFDLKSLQAYCRSPASKDDLSCSYGRDRAQAPEAFVERFDGSYRDPRVGKLVLLDPALGSAVRADSLGAIRLPSLVVGAVDNDFIPWQRHGARYAKALPQARTVLLNGQEGHFVFLSPCDHAVRAQGVPLCQDRPGVDRAAVHEALAAQIVDFVGRDDEGRTSAPQAQAQRKPRSSFAMEMLLYTPRWVFGLLAALCVFGLMQVRTREVRIAVSLILPVAMLVLSLSGVWRYVGWDAAALACWALGLALAAALCLRLMDGRLARFDADSGKLLIQGSWAPLFVILGIFVLRYALGVVTAMQLPFVHSPHFPWSVGLALGALSGFFLARGLVFWRAARARPATA